MSIKIPSKKYFRKAQEILYSDEFNLKTKDFNYYLINEKINDSQSFQKLLDANGIPTHLKISPGTSERCAFDYYLDQICKDLKAHTYRTYTVPKGSFESRRALAYYESLDIENNSLDADDICLSVGSTGAITLVFEALKQAFPRGEVVIPVPTYYLYSLTSRYFDLTFKEVLCYKKIDSKTRSFIDVDSIIRKTTQETSLVVMVNPANPSGEVYSENDIRKIIKDAQQKDYLLLVDELFSDLVFGNFIQVVKIASELNALDKIIVIKGYSKNKNLAGLRLGYVFSKNKRLMNTIESIAEVRNCFPFGEQYTGLIILDSFVQCVKKLTEKELSLESVIKKIKKEFSFSNYICEKSNTELKNLCVSYCKYFQEQISFYKNEYDLIIDLLQTEIEYTTPTASAFNTFLKIKDLDKVNYFDFCFNLFLTTGVKTQIGPAFGLRQSDWEQRKNLGFWLRITFARNPETFTEGIRRFITFKRVYLKNPSIFIQTDLLF